jgi:hypothetical protein
MRKFSLLIVTFCLFAVITAAQSAYVSIIAPVFHKKIDSTSTAGCTYIGEASDLKAADDENKWRVYRIQTTLYAIDIQFANYSPDFNQKWSNRTSAAY